MSKAIYLMAAVLFLHTLCYAKIEQHYTKWEHKVSGSAIRNIDFIYLINLDARPEKLNRSLKELVPYHIVPERFSAIYGWGLPVSVFNDVGLCYFQWMWRGKENVLHFPPHWNGSSQFIALSDDWHGSTVFSGWTTPGAIGCTLSHLSVLHDAYKSGYETIWVIEDDIKVEQDPCLLAHLIDELDKEVGKEGWDILYTDWDYLKDLDREKDLLAQIPYKWRPDMPFFDLEPLLEYTPVGEHFFKIGGRNCTHSMLIRRAGMKKILDFYEDRGMFLPIDHELSFVPDLRLYVLRENIVSCFDPFVSDTKNRYFQ